MFETGTTVTRAIETLRLEGEGPLVVQDMAGVLEGVSPDYRILTVDRKTDLPKATWSMTLVRGGNVDA